MEMKHSLISHQVKPFICLKVVKRMDSNLNKSPIITSTIGRHLINAGEPSGCRMLFCGGFFPQKCIIIELENLKNIS